MSYTLRPESAGTHPEYAGKNAKLDQITSDEDRAVVNLVNYVESLGVDITRVVGAGPDWTVGDEIAYLVGRVTVETYVRGCLVGWHSAAHTGHVADCTDERCSTPYLV